MPTTYEQAGPLRRLVRATGRSALLSRVYARTLHHVDKPVHRLTRGRTTATALLSGLPVVLLTTRGARSGQPRTWPLLGLVHEGRLVVVASNYGSQHHPAWYHNLRADPRAEVVVDGVRSSVVAHEAEGAEREQLWREGLAYYPGWTAYERRAAPRRIPVLVLTPAQTTSAPRS